MGEYYTKFSFPLKKEFQIESLQICKYVTYIRYNKSIFSVEKRNTVMEEDTESKKENGEHPFFLYWRVRLHKPVLRIIIFHFVESLFLISLALEESSELSEAEGRGWCDQPEQQGD